MFKLYQVVNGKAHLCGYWNGNKRPLVAMAIKLPKDLSRRSPVGGKVRAKAWSEGHYY